MSNAITGYNDYLLTHLEEAIQRAHNIRFNVSFLMESGVKLLTPSLLQAVENGVRVRILTGRYMGITEPSAIYWLKHYLGKNLDIRFYSDSLRSFHPKAYLFEYEEDAEIFVGSSNISQAALTTGIEWNYRLLRSRSPEDYQKFSETFDDLFRQAEVIDEKVLREYAASWKKPRFVRIEDRTARHSGLQVVSDQKPQPIGAQIEALHELKRAREEGVTRGLVVAATGVGKTYLAAFDSAEFSRVLFVAHRQEILFQAERTFRSVRPEARTGFFAGFQKDLDAEICFATIQTLSREENLDLFDPRYFDYVVVDEFHHAAADSYVRVLSHFQPEFLLGLTATPYRSDNRDIYALCEDNVIYELYLKDAINRGLLVPFRYYAIYDPTDYTEVKQHNGRYVIEDLERQLSNVNRANLVLEQYRKLAGRRTLGFCTSINHANYMARYFSKRGIPSVAVHSGEETDYAAERQAAINMLGEGQIKVIFCVDIFNEGVDIPEIDTVMFLRPTESYVVFLQQLGRGLRKHPEKEYLTVIDFIGNYKRAHYIPILLAGENPMNPNLTRGRKPTDYAYPEDCQVNFDFRVLDLFEELKKHDPLSRRMEEDYFRLKEELGRRPARLDIYEGSDIPIREFLKEGWLRFLHSIGELTEEESRWLDKPAERFLRELEKTHLTKSYKIPTIKAFLDKGSVLHCVPLGRIGKVFMDFYVSSRVHQKDLRDRSNRNWSQWGLDRFTSLAVRNPVKFLGRSDFFYYDEVNKNFCLADSLRNYLSPCLASHIADILEYRRRDYFRRRFKE